MKLILWYFLLVSVSVSAASKNWFGYTQGTAAQYYQEKNYQGSLELFQDLMTHDPYNPEYNYNVGTVLYRQKKYQDAQQSFARVLEHQDAPLQLKEQAYFNCGNCWYQLAKWQDAIDAYQQALNIHAENQAARHNLQLALQKLQEEQIKNQQENKQQQSQDKDKHKEQNKEQSCCPDGSPENQQGDQQKQSAGNDQHQNNQSKKQKNQGQPEKKSGSEKNDEGDDQENQHAGQQADQQKNGQQQGQEGQGPNDENDGMQDNSEMNQAAQKKSDQKKALQNKLQDSGTDGTQDSLEQDFTHTQGAKEEMQTDDQKGYEQQAQARSFKDDNKEKSTGAFHKSEFKNELQNLYETKACQDERLTDYHASVMQTLEELEEKVQKHIIKNKVALQGSGQHGKRNW